MKFTSFFTAMIPLLVVSVFSKGPVSKDPVISNDIVVSKDITYAPNKKPVKGSPMLACLGIKYKDMNRYTSKSECASVAKQTATFYKDNSKSALTMRSDGFKSDVPLNGNKKNVNNAEKYAMKDYEKTHKPADYYQIISIFTNNHAGGNVAHLSGTLIRTAEHEVGHLLGLGHAGAYEYSKDGKVSLDSYGDNLSVMGRYPSGFLTAPQYYHQGWLNGEVALYEPGKIYELRRISNFKESSLAAIMIPAKYFVSPDSVEESFEDSSDDTAPTADPDEDPVVRKSKGAARDGYISFPQGCKDGCIAYHLSNGGGSQRIKIINNEYFDKYFTGVTIKLLKFTGNSVIVQIKTMKDPK